LEIRDRFEPVAFKLSAYPTHYDEATAFGAVHCEYSPHANAIDGLAI
jgi:hypothetical protein